MSSRADPPAQALAWAAGAISPGAVVVRVQRLTGGITSAVHGLTIEDVRGRAHRVVLRRWVEPLWPQGGDDDPAEAVDREARVLTALADSGLPVPTLVAADSDGCDAGAPAVLMSRLPGRIRLAPKDPGQWTRQLAETLARIHAVSPAMALPSFESWLRLDRVDVPSWSTRPGMWREAIALARQPHIEPAGGFVHHDYQPFNVLWSSAGRLCGIVDWVWASQGPPDCDITHCRLNLCLLASAERAEEFRRVYEAAAGRVLDPWWDVASIADYLVGWSADGLQRQAGRRLRIDPGRLHQEVEALLAGALRRSL